MIKNVNIKRNKDGIHHVKAKDLIDLVWGLGYCHAVDRSLQILLMRILGKGQASQYLSSDESMLQTDIFFRKMNWQGGLQEEVNKLSVEEKSLCQSYCDGVNFRLSKKFPWELRLLGYTPDKWEIKDSIMLSRMTGYLTLAQSQAEMERFLLQMIQAGISREKLWELFPKGLENLDIDLLQKVQFEERIVPDGIWKTIVPPMVGSNNWVVSGSKTQSGKPFLANDPHLETNRLPNVWYEVLLESSDNYIMGGSMPGLPGVLIGRNANLSWGATYSFMDAVDSWVEDCQDGKYRKEGEWHSFAERKELIHRKKKPDSEVVFYENEHGTLEGDPHNKGYYLTTSWASSRAGAKSISQMLKMYKARSVEEGMEFLGQIETAWNWVLADKAGNIGYQMSGLCPIRKEGASGLLPLPGWLAENDWQGFANYQDLPRCLNPKQGYFATANQDLNEWGKVQPINLPMGDYRAKRISHLLAEKDNHSLEDMKKIQYDVFSKQGEQFMETIKPLLDENNPASRALLEWDLCYDLDSKAAFLFEKIYQNLHKEVFAKGGLSEAAFDYLWEQTGIFIDFYQNFDSILLKNSSLWFQEREQNEIYRKAIQEALKEPLQKWGESNQLLLQNLIFGGKLPKFFGFDRGPIPLRGGRATPHQGQIYQSSGRTTSFTPSYRFVTDVAESEIHSNMAGGPSDRRFSPWYCSDLDNWRNQYYKKIGIDKG